MLVDNSRSLSFIFLEVCLTKQRKIAKEIKKAIQMGKFSTQLSNSCAHGLEYGAYRRTLPKGLMSWLSVVDCVERVCFLKQFGVLLSIRKAC